MKKQTLFLIIMSLIVMTTVYSQEYSTQKNVVFDVEVRVVDKENSKPIKNADVSINGKLFRYNYINEYYPVKAMVGQQLVVVHPGFETVYYDIKSNEEIKILVEGFNYSNYSRKIKSYNKSESKKDLFIQNLDSASYYKNTDIEKSLSFVENILKEDNSSNQQAVIYKLLGSIYLQWNQYDQKYHVNAQK